MLVKTKVSRQNSNITKYRCDDRWKDIYRTLEYLFGDGYK